MELCTENNHNHACIVFSNFQAHGNSVILAEQIVGCGVSLSDSICHEQTKSVSLFEGLLTLTDGHLTIKVVLDTLLTKTPTGDIQIKLGYGVIYRIGTDYRETKILEDILRVRSQTQGRGSRAEGAVSGVLTHPVMEAFIRQKWHAARFLFHGHIRMWLLFTVLFSCYLRVEINTQLIRNEFKDKLTQWKHDLGNGTKSDFQVKALLTTTGNLSRCLKVINQSEEKGIGQNSTFLNTTDQVDDKLSSPVIKICHPQQYPWCHPDIGLLRDSSRVLYLSLLAVSATIWLALLVRFCLDLLPNIPPLKKWGSGPLLPVRLAKDCDKNWFKNFANLSTTTIILVAMMICYHSDGQDIKLEPARPFVDFDDGFRFIEVFLLFLALYFLVDFINEVVTKKKNWSNWSQLADPSASFQMVSSLSAIVALDRKCYLTSGDNSGAGPATAAGAIGITFAYLCLILKHGRYSSTAIGNFSTMFHIILKKLRSYLVVAFVLLFGFSFGFWVVKQHENKEDDARFKDFLTSIKACFVMFFGGFDEYDDVLSFDEEIKKDHHLTLAAFYVLFLMMIIVTSLGMLNILLAAIITDYNKNMKEVHLQNLLFMAQYSVVLEQGLGREIKDFLVNKLNIQSLKSWTRLEEGNDTYTYCTRDLCYAEEDKITHIHPEDEFSNIIAEQSRSDCP